MKKRGLASPDCGDALALTFAYPIPEAAPERRSRRYKMPDPIDPRRRVPSHTARMGMFQAVSAAWPARTPAASSAL